jgi:hypothetical protein
VPLPRWVDARWNTSGGMRLILSCTGVLVVGVTSVARESEGESERERERVPAFPFSPCLSTSVNCVNVYQCALGRPWTSPFIDTRRCPAIQWGCSYVITWLAEKRLEPCTCVLTWLSGKCLEPCRSIAGGAAWMLLTFPCFRRRLRAIRRHGRTRGTIITCYWSNLRWDTGLVPS